jgi:hypothetical protein
MGNGALLLTSTWKPQRIDPKLPPPQRDRQSTTIKPQECSSPGPLVVVNL